MVCFFLLNDYTASAMAEDDVDFICTVLTDAVAVLADAESSPLNRSEAQRFCQELKDKPQLCVPCGLRLTDRSKTIAVRLLGFQILEHYVTHHWTQASQQEKTQLRTKAMDFMSAAANFRLGEDYAFLEAIARVKVELIKREEPENWPTMLGELGAFMGKGHVQVELGMLVLGKVSEAVVAIEGPLYVTENKNVRLILQMSRSLLQDRIEKYQFLKKRKNQEPVAQACARAIIAVLKTMTGYLAWVPPFHVTSNRCSLLENIWCLLNEPCFGVHASECLFVAINKLASHPNEKSILVLFNNVARLYVFPVSLTTCSLALTDQRYAFLKTICRMMCIFGQDLCRIMSLKSWHTLPSIVNTYLDSLLGFTTHSSHYLSSLTQSTWKALFSVERLSKDRRILSMIPKYLSASRTKLLKVGFPSKNDSPSCESSCIDFITDVEFYKFLKKFRGDQKQVIDVVCKLDQLTCFQRASVWLKDLVQPLPHSTSESSPVESSLHSNSTISFLQWEAMTFFFKVIVTNMFQNLKREAIPVKDGMHLLQLLLNFKTKDPRILACVPINIYTLLPLLRLKTECLTPVLSKLLEIIEEVDVKSHTCNSVRRDACMFIIQLCQSHAKILLPNFALLFNRVKQLLCDELLQLTQIVKSTLMEAMVVLINNFNKFELQKFYLEELMLPASSLWLSKDMQITVADPESFVSYVGGDLLVTNRTVESPTDLNRSGMIHCVATILGVLRRTKSPTDLEKIGLVSNEHVLCNPCAELVLKLLDNLFVLIRTQHNLYFPGLLSKMGELLSKSLNQSKINNNSLLKLPQPLLDIYDPPEYTTALERMQGFFSALYTSCFYILGCACTSLNKDFYSIGNLADKIGSSAFVNLEYVPHYRILCIVRAFLRPLLLNCPHEYHESLASPVFVLFLTSLHSRLFYDRNDIDQTNLVSKEESVFEKSKLEESLLTKEVLQLIIDCCIDKDKITITDEPSFMNAHREPHDNVCQLGADIIASASNECSEDPATSPASQITEASVSASFCEDSEIRVSAACCENGKSVISAVSRQGADANVDTVETDACCLSNDDAVTVVCTTESDDDMSIADAHSSISRENVGKSKEFDVACYRPSENVDSSSEANKACSVTNQCPYCVTVADKTDVCVVLAKIEANNMSSEDIDGEMAAEVPQNQHSVAKEQAPLTKLGICLMKDEDVRAVLLNTSFSALMWKDFCHKAATGLCWPLLQHVMFEPLLLDTVIHLFTKVIKALQIHRHDLLVSNTIDCLAYRVYASLRPQYIELNRVMRQIPNINLFSLDTFDERLLDATIQKPDPGLQQVFKDLIKSDVHEPFSEQENSLDNVPKSTRKSLKHPMSTKLPQTASKLKKRSR